MQPFFSVIIPLYNKEKYISKTLETVLNQSFQDFEVIVINDGSTDNSVAEVEKFNNKRIKVFNQKNQGLSAARNKGITESKSEYLAFLDADDLWCHDYLLNTSKTIKDNDNLKIFATNFYELWPKTRVILQPKTETNSALKILKKHNQLINASLTPSAFVTHKSVPKTIGYFDTTINYAEDEDFYIRCLKQHAIVYNETPFVYYRLGTDGQMTKPNTTFNKIVPDFDKYLDNSTSKGLRNYINFIHYKLMILYKAENNKKLIKHYKSKIDPTKLNLVQQLKYHLPTAIFNLSKKMYFKIVSK